MNLFEGKTGKISKVDFRRLVFENESLRGFRSETIDKYLNELSENTKWITFEQFRNFMKAETNSLNNPLFIIELKLAFNEVDTNKDGFISQQEARKGITLAGQHIPGLSFDRIAQIFDDDGDGQLSFQEFSNNINKIISQTN